MEEWDNLIFAFLAGECSASQQEQIHDWIKEKPENLVYFQKQEKLWQQSAINVTQFEPDVQQAIQTIHARIDAKDSSKVMEFPSRSRVRQLAYYSMRIAASVIFIIGIGLGGYFITRNVADTTSSFIELTTSDQTRTITLADGTTIWLNTNSKIRYPEKFDHQTREVSLEGEAYFQVARDPEKPFRIKAFNSTTQVLGTSFNVRAISAEDKIIITVTSGKVAFSNAEMANTVYLLKGDKGILLKNKNEVQKVLNDDINFLSWQTGKIIFNNTPLSEVAFILSRHYHKKISIAENLSRCRFTSTFDRQTLDEVLDELTIIQGIRLKRTSDSIVLDGDGC